MALPESIVQDSPPQAALSAIDPRDPPVHALSMDELLTLHEHPVFLRREAVEFGYDDRALRAALRDRQMYRIRQGAYTAYDTWETSSPEDRHRLRCAAVILTHGRNVALSHTSAAVEFGLRLHNADLSKVHLTRLDKGAGYVTDDIVYHEGLWTPDDIFQKDDFLLTSPARAALESASLQDVPSGLVTLDSLLDLDLGDEDALSREFKSQRHWPKTQHLHVTVRLTRRGAQSSGESLSRHMMWTQHVPEPQLQYHVYDDRGILIGITDFAWPDDGVLGEFDGRIKYGRLLKPGDSVEEVVFREKQREDLLREVTGSFMVRFIWQDLQRPVTTGRRILTQLRRGRAA